MELLNHYIWSSLERISYFTISTLCNVADFGHYEGSTWVMNFGENPQHDFPKMRGGSTAFWNFSENSSVGTGFPNFEQVKSEILALESLWKYPLALIK